MLKILCNALILITLLSGCLSLPPEYTSKLTTEKFAHSEKCKIKGNQIFLQDIYYKLYQNPFDQEDKVAAINATTNEKRCLAKVNEIIRDPEKESQYRVIISYQNVKVLKNKSDRFNHPDIPVKVHEAPIFYGDYYDILIMEKPAYFPPVENRYFLAIKNPANHSSDNFQDVLLEGWNGKSKIESTKNASIAASIINFPRANFLYVTIKNNSPNRIYYNPSKISFQFDNKVNQKPNLHFSNILVTILPGQTHITWLPFPHKDSFLAFDQLHVRIPFLNHRSEPLLNASATFHKNKNKKIHHHSYETWDKYNFSLILGGHFYRTSKLKNLLQNNYAAGFQLNWFPFKNLHHGFSMAMLGSGSNHTSTIGGISFHRGVLSTLGIGYIYRRYISSKKTIVSYSITPGAQLFYHRLASEKESTIEKGYGLLQTISHDWLISNEGIGTYSIGLMVYHQWVLTSSVPMNGHVFGAGINFKMGM